MIIRVGKDQKSVAKVVTPHPRAVSRRLGLCVTSFQLLRAVSQTLFFFFFFLVMQLSISNTAPGCAALKIQSIGTAVQ